MLKRCIERGICYYVGFNFHFAVNGSKDDTSNWFWCCTKVRVHDTADSRFRTGPNSRPNLKYWGTLPNEDKDEFSRRNCDVVVGGASKSKCKIGE